MADRAEGERCNAFSAEPIRMSDRRHGAEQPDLHVVAMLEWEQQQLDVGARALGGARDGAGDDG
jgi:hypothetical protein